MITQNYWFSLKSHIYVEFKEKEILLYDTQKGSYMKITNPEIISLIKDMYETENLGVVELYTEKFNNTDIKLIIENLIQLEIADLDIINNDAPKPIKLIPILNLQNDIEKIKEWVKDEKEKALLLGKDTLKYLFEVNIYINNICDVNCEFCSNHVKQIECCTIKKGKSDELSIEIIKDILRQIKYSSVYRINIMGGDIYKYSQLGELRDIILEFSNKVVHFYTHYKNYIKNSLIEDLPLNLIIDFPNNKTITQKIFSDINNNCTVHFIIKDENEYEKAESIIEENNLIKAEIHPFYTGENLSFFKENVFMDEDDIFSTTQQMREIFRNKKANKNFFGKLYILPDGEVKANMNTSSLGNIKSDDILNLVNKELINNTAWRYIRDKSPCDQCLNRFICPPISNYEIALNRLNLCHLQY